MRKKKKPTSVSRTIISYRSKSGRKTHWTKAHYVTLKLPHYKKAFKLKIPKLLKKKEIDALVKQKTEALLATRLERIHGSTIIYRDAKKRLTTWDKAKTAEIKIGRKLTKISFPKTKKNRREALSLVNQVIAKDFTKRSASVLKEKKIKRRTKKPSSKIKFKTYSFKGPSYKDEESYWLRTLKIVTLEQAIVVSKENVVNTAKILYQIGKKIAVPTFEKLSKPLNFHFRIRGQGNYEKEDRTIDQLGFAENQRTVAKTSEVKQHMKNTLKKFIVSMRGNSYKTGYLDQKVSKELLVIGLQIDFKE